MQGADKPLPVALTGLSVAISAGVGGISRVMADSFAACGASVFLRDVDAEALAACPHPAMRADMGETAESKAFVNAAAAHLGGLDVLVNDAGIAGPRNLPEAITTRLRQAMRKVVADPEFSRLMSATTASSGCIGKFRPRVSLAASRSDSPRLKAQQ